MRRVLLLLSPFLLGIAGALPFQSEATSATPSITVSVSSWLQGWPMDGHDPQRTSLSPLAGPTQPRRVRTRASFTADLVAPDGSIVGTSGSYPNVELAVMKPGGSISILSRSVVGASALRRDGTILTDEGDAGRAEAVSATGKLLWQRSSIGLPKSAVPLVAGDGRFFIPAEGHPGLTSGLWVLSPRGKVAGRAARGIPTFGVALGLDGSVYSLLYDKANEASFAVAYSPALQETWRYRLSTPLEESRCDCLVVGPAGRLYVGEGNTVIALEAQGHLAWSFAKPDGLLSLAERPDGSLLAAGSRTLTAISDQGQKLWDADIHTDQPGGVNGYLDAPSVAVDRAGIAYVGTANGQVLAIDATGQITARLAGGGYRYGQTPRVLLAPHHTLVVSGTDSVLRIYR